MSLTGSMEMTQMSEVPCADPEGCVYRCKYGCRYAADELVKMAKELDRKEEDSDGQP